MIEYPTVRYRCEHCHKSYARKGACATHEAECHLDPAVRACTTCAHFTRQHLGTNDCAVDAFPVFDDWNGRELLSDFVRHCPQYLCGHGGPPDRRGNRCA